MNSYIIKIKNKIYNKFSKQEVLKNIALTYFNRIICLFIGLTSSILIARFLGAEERGLLAASIILTGLSVQFGNLGLHTSNTYELSKNPDNLPQILGNSLLVGIGFSGLIIIILTIIYWTKPNLFQIHDTLWNLTLLGIPIGLTYLLLQNLFLGLQKFKEFNIIDLLIKIIYTALAILCITRGKNNANWIVFVTHIATFIGVVWCFNKLIVKKPKIDFYLFKRNFKYSIKSYLSCLLFYAIQRSSLLVVMAKSGSNEAGQLAIAMQLIDISFILPTTIGTILFPTFSSDNNLEKKVNLFKKYQKYIFIIMFPYCLVLAFMSKQLVVLLFGNEYLRAATCLLYLLPGLLFMSINSLQMNFLASFGMPRILVYFPFLALVILFSSFFIFETSYTANIAGLFFSICNFIIWFLNFFYLKKYITIKQETN